MSKLLGKALLAARKQRGFTQQAVAEALGVSRVAVSQWENGSSDPSTENLIRICDYLGLNLSAATAGMVKIRSFIPLDASDKEDPEPLLYVRDRRPEFRDTNDEFIRFLDGNPVSPGRTRDVPVYASAYAGDDGDFYRTDEIIDFVRRPISMGGGVHSLYALYVPSSALSPRYEMGELIFLTSGRPAVPGDYIAIRLKREDTEAQLWILRKLIGRNKETLSCETLTPPALFNIPVETVETFHRIMGWGELIDS